ncbi:MAG: hypothetical protein ACLR6J_03090 [Parabacteroides merdae]
MDLAAGAISYALAKREQKPRGIAWKEVELAKNEHQKLNAFWYPTISAAGAYVHMSNPIEVRQSLNQFTDPAKEYVHSIPLQRPVYLITSR